MIQIVRNESQSGIKHFVCDKKDELSKISLRAILMGSTCFVIEEDAFYILNGSAEWVEVKNLNSSSSGGSSSDDGREPLDEIPSNIPIDENNTYIWDGGEVKE